MFYGGHAKGLVRVEKEIAPPEVKAVTYLPFLIAAISSQRNQRCDWVGHKLNTNYFEENKNYNCGFPIVFVPLLYHAPTVGDGKPQ